MIEQLLSSFSGSSDAGSVLQSLVAQGLTPDKAQGAIAATAEGAQHAAAEMGPAALLGLLGGGGGGAGGALGALGGMLGGGGAGGGLGGALGGALGGGGGGALGGLGAMLGGGGASGGDAMTDKIAAFVATKVGLDPSMAKMVVGVVLPKILEFVRSRAG